MTEANRLSLGATVLCLLIACALFGCKAPQDTETAAAPGGAMPRFDPGGPNAAEYGEQQGYPVAVIERPRFMVGSFSHMDQQFEGRSIRRADRPSRLHRAAAEPGLAYRWNGKSLSLDDYLARNPVTGLIIVRGDTILVERYQYARNDKHRFMSASMAKTVTAMLLGIAIAEGKIRSVNDAAATYAPALADTEYGRTSLRHLLQMSSGIRFEEGYSGTDDFARLWRDTVSQRGAGGAAAVNSFNDRVRGSGSAFSYASAETQVLGLALAGAVGRPLAQYLQEKIWQPMGAEADASWLIDAAGQEAAFCCLNAVLRDYARLALLLANDGRLGDKQIIPKAWLQEATTVPEDRPDLKLVWPATGFGYGYQTWIFQGPGRMFALLGVYGQVIYVDPASRLVLIQTAVRKQPADPNDETLILWRAAVEQLGSTSK